MNKFEALQLLGLSGSVASEDIKLAYKRKAKEFHPDKNPSGVEVMKMINVAYDLVKNEKNVNVFEDKVMSEYPETLTKALSIVLNLGLIIEVCGLWIWISGDTKTHKDALKNAGYRWSPKKKMWYYRPAKAKSRKYWSKDKSEWTMDKIRETFGASSPRDTKNKGLCGYYIEKGKA